MDVFLKLPCFLHETTNVGNLISGSSDSSKPSLYTWKFLVCALLKPSLKDFEHYFTSVWDEWNCAVVWAFFSNAFLWSRCFSGTLAFSMIQQMLAIWSLVLLPFQNPAWTSGSSWFMYCWSLNFEHYFTSVWDECNCVAFLGIAFPLDWNENWPFPVLWPLLSFPNLLTYWVQHFHSIIF